MNPGAADPEAVLRAKRAYEAALAVLAGGGLAAYKHFVRVPITDPPAGRAPPR